MADRTDVVIMRAAGTGRHAEARGWRRDARRCVEARHESKGARKTLAKGGGIIQRSCGESGGPACLNGMVGRSSHAFMSTSHGVFTRPRSHGLHKSTSHEDFTWRR
ncbi:hypothetical protein QJS04_geneDACA010302 [Acorus gramineus]|uniref:Uncharacterized protein n=1 Tax=Acorus gramineus TaxID=55184 RepID=A0AAV9A750_ACOGR|nr:hypothetical protein QJS04_geneDACA010302 [Acorus gramineus]